MTASLQTAEASLLSRPERQWRAVICLAWPLAMGAAPLLVAIGSLPLCAFRQASGLPCPLCGGTHACVALLQGDLAAAWQANPGVLPLLVVAVAHTGMLALEALSGHDLGHAQFWSRAWSGVGAILLLAWLLRLTGWL
jgi:hypothetical protein